eukprot:gnl/TRDRNA2_/TRDRNA2_29207_c0_seq2.p1 gnl/TRDRNA2_/TRDRNA2_29207_c0~~gnl/TRDRNA2_/TRDRNA2_29207_c0_seq2.p1  ORF type:complete len:206 (+),score=33.02 gnl/TRDRNA2_/TRDRNA2_29207_c0_seq2:39-656(+)
MLPQTCADCWQQLHAALRRPHLRVIGHDTTLASEGGKAIVQLEIRLVSGELLATINAKPGWTAENVAQRLDECTKPGKRIAKFVVCTNSSSHDIKVLEGRRTLAEVSPTGTCLTLQVVYRAPWPASCVGEYLWTENGGLGREHLFLFADGTYKYASEEPDPESFMLEHAVLFTSSGTWEYDEIAGDVVCLGERFSEQRLAKGRVV